MKFVLLILNCKKYSHKATIQKQTWLSNLDNYFHIIGDKDICKENAYHFDMENKILYTNTEDDYNSLPAKVITAFKAIHETMTVDYIFKTDDDQRLIQPNFFNTLSNILTEKLKSDNTLVYYGGKAIKINTHVSRYYVEHPELPHDIILESCTYCNGRFYLLHHEAVANLLQKYDAICSRFIEDHAIGYYLDIHLRDKLLMINNDMVFVDNL
jgi:hypothetical protein